MIDQREQRDSLCVQYCLHFFYRLVYGVLASYVDNSRVAIECHGCLLSIFKLRMSGASDRNQIDCHRHSDQRQKESNQDSLSRRMRVGRRAAI